MNRERKEIGASGGKERYLCAAEMRLGEKEERGENSNWI